MKTTFFLVKKAIAIEHRGVATWGAEIVFKRPENSANDSLKNNYD